MAVSSDASSESGGFSLDGGGWGLFRQPQVQHVIGDVHRGDGCVHPPLHWHPHTHPAMKQSIMF